MGLAIQEQAYTSFKPLLTFMIKYCIFEVQVHSNAGVPCICDADERGFSDPSRIKSLSAAFFYFKVEGGYEYIASPFVSK